MRPTLKPIALALALAARGDSGGSEPDTTALTTSPTTSEAHTIVSNSVPDIADSTTATAPDSATEPDSATAPTDATATAPADTTIIDDTQTPSDTASPTELAAIDAVCATIDAFTLPADPARGAALTPTIGELTPTLADAKGNLTYTWTLDGHATDYASEVPAGVTRAGDVWALTITASFALPSTCSHSESLTIVEHDPVCAAATITPANATVATSLTCACSGYSDADGDAASSPGCLLSNGADTCALPAGSASGGTTLTCTLTPKNARSSGASVSRSITLGNAAPSSPAAIADA